MPILGALSPGKKAAPAELDVAALPSAVWRAAALCDEDTITAWLDGGGSCDAREQKLQRTLLMAACEQGQEPIVELLLERGADVEALHVLGGTALMFAVTNAHPAVVRRLLGEGARVDVRDYKHGKTALNWAEYDGHHAIAALLRRAEAGESRQKLSQPVAPEASVAKTKLPNEMCAAAEVGDEAAVAAWLDSAAGHVDAREAEGKETLLMIASIEGHEQLVRLLLGKEAAVNLHDTDGRTALMGAALYGRLAVARRLLLAGAHVDIKDANGWNALMRAEGRGHDAVVQLLKNPPRKGAGHGATAAGVGGTPPKLTPMAAAWAARKNARLSAMEDEAEAEAPGTEGRSRVAASAGLALKLARWGNKRRGSEAQQARDNEMRQLMVATAGTPRGSRGATPRPAKGATGAPVSA